MIDTAAYLLGRVSFFAIVFAVVFAGHCGVSAMRNRRDLRRSVMFALEITGIVLIFSVVGSFMR